MNPRRSVGDALGYPVQAAARTGTLDVNPDVCDILLVYVDFDPRRRREREVAQLLCNAVYDSRSDVFRLAARAGLGWGGMGGRATARRGGGTIKADECPARRGLARGATHTMLFAVVLASGSLSFGVSRPAR